MTGCVKLMIYILVVFFSNINCLPLLTCNQSIDTCKISLKISDLNPLQNTLNIINNELGVLYMYNYTFTYGNKLNFNTLYYTTEWTSLSETHSFCAASSLCNQVKNCSTIVDRTMNGVILSSAKDYSGKYKCVETSCVWSTGSCPCCLYQIWAIKPIDPGYQFRVNSIIPSNFHIYLDGPGVHINTTLTSVCNKGCFNVSSFVTPDLDNKRFVYDTATGISIARFQDISTSSLLEGSLTEIKANQFSDLNFPSTNVQVSNLGTFTDTYNQPPIMRQSYIKNIWQSTPLPSNIYKRFENTLPVYYYMNQPSDQSYSIEYEFHKDFIVPCIRLELFINDDTSFTIKVINPCDWLDIPLVYTLNDKYNYPILLVNETNTFIPIYFINKISFLYNEKVYTKHYTKQSPDNNQGLTVTSKIISPTKIHTNDHVPSTHSILSIISFGVGIIILLSVTVILLLQLAKPKIQPEYVATDVI